MMRRFLFALLPALAMAADRGSDAVPLFFIANHGQAPETVRFVAQGSGLTAFFSAREARFRRADAVLRVEFVGARETVAIEGSRILSGKANFLIGDESEWRLDVPLHQEILYRELYPGIDMRYGSERRNLKSEFIVAPGANPADIRLRYLTDGALRIDASGALIIPVGGHDLREHAPVIYQWRDGERVEIAGRYSLSDDVVGFSISDYDQSLPLVIDPVLSYSTLLGGASSDAALGLAVDSAGAAYVAGYTASLDFPTSSPEQNYNAGSNDIFVAKLNAAGNGLVYCTYIGGKGDDRATAIAVDSSGAAYVTGWTKSTAFPLKNALQTKLAGTKNAFVLKLAAAGNALVYSTYLGGNGSDAGNGIAVDSSGNAYVVGDTTSVSFPATGFQKGIKGTQDAFVAKLTAAGALSYSTYLGGTSDEHGAAIAVNSSGNAFVTGSTWSSDFPTASALQTALGGGQDAFVAKLAADGSSLVFSTFLGGAGGTVGYPEVGQGIALDASGNVYVTGTTSSANFPLSHAVQSSLSGATDAFVAKLTGSGTLSYSTYLGGTGMDNGNAIAVDSSGNAYVVGSTFSSDLAVVSATQSASGGDYDAFWAELNSTGSALQLFSYLGGNGSDTATSVALDSAGGLYIAGWTLSTNFPLLNGYQSSNAGNYGAFITKVTTATGPPAAVSVTPSSGSGTSQTFTFVFSDPKGASVILSAQLLFNATMTFANGCYLYFNRAANTVYLTNDAGTAWQTPVTIGQSGTLQNSQCSVNPQSSSATTSGSTLTLNLTVTFQAGFAGSKNVYMEVYDGTGDSGWQQRGTWTIASGPPTVVSVAPASGSSVSQTFTFVYSDAKGYAAIVSSQVLFNNPFTFANGCYLFFNRAANTLYLTNDAGTAWQTPVTLGQTGTLQNSQCSVNPQSSSASGSGNNLTLNIAVTFQTTFGGTRNIYSEVYDGTGDSGWVQRGAWTVPAPTPSAVSVSPASGSGTTQPFSFTFSDPQGFSAIASVQILFNSPFGFASGCYILYNRAANSIYLTNDAGTAWQSPVTPHWPGTLQNSQCSVDASGSTVTGTGNNMALNLALTFKAAFTGAKNVYMEVYDGSGDSGWQQRGTWTVP